MQTKQWAEILSLQKHFKKALGGSKHNTELCVPWMY